MLAKYGDSLLYTWILEVRNLVPGTGISQSHSLPKRMRRLSSAWEPCLTGESPGRHVTISKVLNSWPVAREIGVSSSGLRMLVVLGEEPVINLGWEIKVSWPQALCPGWVVGPSMEDYIRGCKEKKIPRPSLTWRWTPAYPELLSFARL